MLKTLMGQMGTRATTKFDIVIGVVAAAMAIGHAVDTYHQYQEENEDTNEDA